MQWITTASSKCLRWCFNSSLIRVKKWMACSDSAAKVLGIVAFIWVISLLLNSQNSTGWVSAWFTASLVRNTKGSSSFCSPVNKIGNKMTLENKAFQLADAEDFTSEIQANQTINRPHPGAASPAGSNACRRQRQRLVPGRTRCGKSGSATHTAFSPNYSLPFLPSYCLAHF
jgi:hypothetical protein